MVETDPKGPRKWFEWSKAARQPAVWLGLSMIAAVWTTLYFDLLTQRQRTLEAATLQGGNLARLLEQNATSMIRAVDRTLLMLRHEYNEKPNHFEPSDLSHLVKFTTLNDDFSIGIAIVTRTGQATALTASNGIIAAANLGDREWFQRQRDAENDELVISKPMQGRLTNKASIILSRRLVDSNGRFAGTIAAAVDPVFIERFLRTIDVGVRGSVLLRDLDGVIFASAGTVGPVVGRQVLQPALRDALARSPTGYYWGGGAVDGVNRLVSYRKSPDLPIITMLGLADSDIFAPYERNRLVFVAAAMILTLLLVLGTIASIGYQFRLTRSSTARRLVERKLFQAKAFLDTVIENIPLPVVVKNPHTLQFELVNRAYESFIGMPREKLIGKTVYDIFPCADAEAITFTDKEASSFDGRAVGGEYVLNTPTSGSRIVSATKLVVRDDKGGASHLIVVLEDVTDRRESEKKIVHMAHHDSVTGLPNRALMLERLEQGLTRVRRGENLAVLCLDLDDFKTVNDTLGHSVGDALLKAVAQRLCGCVRETDTVARFGGDEFSILQIAPGSSDDVTVLARRIVEVISEPYDLGSHRVNVGISIGIAVAPTDGVDPDQLLKNADLAMYRTKAEERGTYRFFEQEMDTRMRARRALELDLREALAKGEFELYYQPLVNLQDGAVCGFEALLRWHHPERGMVSPVEFIPVAESTGLIASIGEWALRQACAEAMNWPAHIMVAVNLSAAQFKSDNLVQMVVSALAETGLPGERLELEITESALLENSLMTSGAVHELRSLGVRIAIDDFGTGYSSLSYLQSFAFDKIKIDRSFISNLSTKHSSIAILRAIVTLASSMGMTTIAEGVETEEQLALVRAEGCTEMQGFLFSPARPASEIARLFLQRAGIVKSAA